MKCEQFFIDIELTPQLQAHLKECEDCCRAYEKWQHIQEEIKALAEKPVDELFQKRWRKALSRQKPALVKALAGLSAAAVAAVILLSIWVKTPQEPFHALGISERVQRTPKEIAQRKQKQKVKRQTLISKEAVNPRKDRLAMHPLQPIRSKVKAKKVVRKQRKIFAKGILQALPAKKSPSVEEYVIRVRAKEQNLTVHIEFGEGAFMEGGSASEQVLSYRVLKPGATHLFPFQAKAGAKVKVALFGREKVVRAFEVPNVEASQEEESPIYPGRVLAFEPVISSSENTIVDLGRLIPKPITVAAIKQAPDLTGEVKLVFQNMEVDISSFQILPGNGEG